MKRWMIVLAVTVAAAMIVPFGAQAQTVNRVVSQYFRWDQTAARANDSATHVIYSHTFLVPALSTGGPKYNVAYLPVHLVGRIVCIANCPAKLGLACTLDGTANANACPNGSAKTANSNGLPYVIFDDNLSPPTDSNLSYTWCVPIKTTGTHQFRLFLATFATNKSTAFAEAGMVNIDLAKLPSASACTAAPSL